MTIRPTLQGRCTSRFIGLNLDVLHEQMETAAKIIYGAQAVFFTGGGIYYVYAASIVGADEFSWFGVGAYVWVGVAYLLVGLAWWVLLLARPDLLSSS